jgi:hypothetical protein
MALNYHWNTRITVCLALAMLSVPLECVAFSQANPRASAHIRRSKIREIEGRSIEGDCTEGDGCAHVRPLPSRTVAHKSTASRTTASRTAAKTTVSSSHAPTQSLRQSLRLQLRARAPQPPACGYPPLPVRGSARSVRTLHALSHRGRRLVERFTASSFTDDVTLGDSTAGEDPVVRDAAIQALGNLNGTALAIDPSNGRILAMVNQKLALSSGAEPCSTIKLAVTLAALDEGLITRDTPVNLGGHYSLTLTPALAHSVNPLLRDAGPQDGLRAREALRQPVRPGRLGRLQHSRRTARQSIPTPNCPPRRVVWAACAPSARASP